MAKEPLLTPAMRNHLLTLYADSDRHYHGVKHIEAMLALAHAHQDQFQDHEAVEAAIWFHDAVYDSRRADNEALSAHMAKDMLDGRIDNERLSHIVAMIQATATHVISAELPEKEKSDMALFLDMDLSVLGSPPQAFDAYEKAVRREYSWVPDEAWRTGRSKVLRGFLDRDAIFHTALFRSLLEERARANMKRSLTTLSR